jgi:antitoxin MazE
MSNRTKTRLVRIGNSRGIRIPKVVIEQLGLGTEVELSVHTDRLVVRSARRPRQGWAKKFREMHERGDDRMIDEFPPTTWDLEEWEW